MNNIFDKYPMNVDETLLNAELHSIREKANTYHIPAILKQCFASIDLTTLNTTDTPTGVRTMVEKVNRFVTNFPDMPNVAAICVYPSLAPIVRQTLSANEVKIAVTAGGFPASQTFIDIKVAECKLSVQHGADELDIVISLSSFLDGNYQTVFDEVAAMNRSVDKPCLKVILETGALKDFNKIRLASFIAMEAGAKIIKTSTGKLEPAATPEAFLIMAQAARDYYNTTGRMVGLKAAGGIVTTTDAILYYSIIKNTLGDAWLTPEYFRIGASRLANKLLSDITGKDTIYF